MIEFSTDLHAVTATDLQGFFEGWPTPPSAATHLAILRGAAAAVVARDHDSSAVIGFVTALSDGVLSAYIPLLEVLPAYRGRGIGRQLVDRVLAELGDLYMVDVVCDSDVAPFYEQLGFQTAGAMVRRNYAHSSGRA